MNRRSFFSLLAAAPAAAIIAPELVELLAPKRTIFLPPRGGWATGGRIPPGRPYLIGENGPEMFVTLTRHSGLEVGDRLYFGSSLPRWKEVVFTVTAVHTSGLAVRS